MENFDHIKKGKALIHYIYPPSGTTSVDGFKDGLIEVIPAKLELLLERSQILKNKKDLDLRAVLATTKKGSLGQYFRASLIFHEFSEYYVIQKWLNYWLSLWYKVTNKPLQSRLTAKLDHIDQEDIEKAKRNPIQDYYDGSLRQLGSRLVGLCPFHKEKSPSFNIYTESNTYHCFGCQAHGDSITFIQHTKELTFPESMRYLL